MVAVWARRIRWRRLGALTITLAAVGLLAAACSSAPPDAAGVASVTTVANKPSTGRSASSSPTGNTASNQPGGAIVGTGGQAGGGSISSSGSRSQQLAYAACMRANGMPNFPDPNAQGVITFRGVNPSSPQFQKAQSSCAHLQAGGPPPSPAEQARMMAQALKMSKCMRSHGITDFPDPQSGPGGGIRISISAGPGHPSDLDPNSPAFQRAQAACQKLLPGRPGPSTAVHGPSGGSGP